MKTSLQDMGWRGGMTFAKGRGIARLSGNAPIYKGKAVEFTGITERHVEVFIEPAPRSFSLDEVHQISFTPQQLLAFIEEIKASKT